jgi:hypothetical protein
LAFYKTEKGDIEELMLSFFQASQNVVAGMEAFPEQMDGKRKLFSLQINDLVLIDASEDEIREKDYTVLSKKLYRVKTLSKQDYRFRHHLASCFHHWDTLEKIVSMPLGMRYW